MKISQPVFVAAALIAATPVLSQAQNTDIEDLKKQVQALQEEVETLKEGPKADPEADGLLKQRFFRGKGLSIGFYGEAKYRFPEQRKDAFDPHRFVLTPSYAINDWLIFNSELELEHGGVDERDNRDARSAHSRFDGELELEQMYVDILINEHFNIRSLGIDLVPVGRINKYHEPTLFYSTERPELYREIIPSTWMEPSIGVWGKITETLDYQLMVSSGLEDNVDGTAGISATSGVRDARPRLRRANESDLAYSARLHYHGLPGLDASTSAYVTEVNGDPGRSTVMALWDIEGLYRVPRTGLELRGDFAYWHIDDPGALLAANIGERMYGWYTEAAYHLWPEAWKEGRGKEMDLVPFVRYSQIRTQSDMPTGVARLNNGRGNRDFLTAGVAYFLNANFVLKADYRHNFDGTAASEAADESEDYFQIGAGIFF